MRKGVGICWCWMKRAKRLYTANCIQQIKTGILSGDIKVGTKLQSSRKASMDLRISRNTVESAYEQLCSEGLIMSKPRKGYFVESLDFGMFPKSKSRGKPGKSSLSVEQLYQNAIYDFRPGNLYLNEIPRTQCQRLINRCFSDYKEGLAHYGSVFGEIGLRAEIRKHIYDYRGVNCGVGQLVVGTGTQFCLGLVCPLIKSRGLAVAMEEPGHDQSRTTLENNGFVVRPVELDKQGLDVKALDETDAVAAYVTPSQQFPTGIVMPITRRLELLEWARRRDALIIEDDRNCHFQHDIKPIPSIQSLQSLHSDRVIYLGSFSNMLFPCMRISYMVIPENLLGEMHKQLDNNAPLVPFLMQKTLELFMREDIGRAISEKQKSIKKKNARPLQARLKTNLETAFT